MLVHAYEGTDLTNAVQLKDETAGFGTSAKLGEVEIISVVVDDPTGVRAFTGHKLWTIRETTCAAGNQVVWYGFVGRKNITRRDYRTGVARIWELQLVEANTFIGRRVLRPVDTPSRPAETVDARITWLLTTVGFSGLISDYGLVESSSVALDPRDYSDQTGADVLRECALESGYNFFIRYREATDDLELIFRNEATSALDTSGLQVSNDLTDVDSAVTWYPNPEANIQQIPDRVAPGIVLPFAGGSSVYDRDAAVAAAFADIDLVAPTASVTTASAANALLAHLLEQHSTEEEKVDNLWIEVPEANVNDVKAGQLISAKFTHGPGWETLRSARVTRKVLARLPSLPRNRWRMGLELQPLATITPPDYTYTDARLMRPSKDGGADTGYAGAGSYYPIHHNNDGDDPQAGDTAYPKTGLIEYIGSVGDRTGLRVLGDGTVTVVLAFSCSKVLLAGGITFAAYVYVNGAGPVLVGSKVHPNMGGTTYGWEPIGPTSLTATIDVVAGDEFTWSLTNTSGTPLSALPTGTGNGSHWFRVYGNLVA